MAVTRHGLTLEAFLALPEEKPALEYAEGAVTQNVAPIFEHGLEVLLADLTPPLTSSRS